MPSGGQGAGVAYLHAGFDGGASAVKLTRPQGCCHGQKRDQESRFPAPVFSTDHAKEALVNPRDCRAQKYTGSAESKGRGSAGGGGSGARASPTLTPLQQNQVCDLRVRPSHKDTV